MQNALDECHWLPGSPRGTTVVDHSNSSRWRRAGAERLGCAPACVTQTCRKSAWSPEATGVFVPVAVAFLRTSQRQLRMAPLRSNRFPIRNCATNPVCSSVRPNRSTPRRIPGDASGGPQVAPFPEFRRQTRVPTRSRRFDVPGGRVRRCIRWPARSGPVSGTPVSPDGGALSFRCSWRADSKVGSRSRAWIFPFTAFTLHRLGSEGGIVPATRNRTATKPSQTAEYAAAIRALHIRRVKPPVFSDPIALAMCGPTWRTITQSRILSRIVIDGLLGRLSPVGPLLFPGKSRPQ